MFTAAVIGAIALFVVGGVFMNRSMHRREAERAEEYRKAAQLRGWQMEFDGHEYRYSGSTEGVKWLAVVNHYRRGPTRSNEPRPLRWKTTDVSFDDGALVIWPDFGRAIEALGIGVPRFVLDLAMRPLAWALGVEAGEAATLARATEVVEGPKGFLFRATHPQRMREWLESGAAHALEAEAAWLANKEKPQHLIIAVLWRHGLQIATPYGSNDLDHLAQVARAGARLAKAARA